MAYLIDAWLERGVPQLRIRDAHTGAVRLRWTRESTGNEADHAFTCDRIAREALQRLFRDLVLLSCTDKIAAEVARASEACLHCTACIDDAAGSANYAQPASVIDSLPSGSCRDT